MINQVKAIAELDKEDRDCLNKLEESIKAEVMKDLGRIPVKGQVKAILSLIEK